MSTLFSDPFSGGDAANLGANWDADDGTNNIDWNVVSGTAENQRPTNNGQFVRTTTNAHAATADVKVTGTQVSASGDGGVFARCTGIPYGANLVAYWVSCAGNNIDLYRSTGGVDTLKIAGGAITQAANGLVAMQCVTNGANCDLQLWYNGVSKGTASDTSPLTTAGRTGLLNWASPGTASRYDDFLVETAGGGGGGPTYPGADGCGVF